MKKLTRIFVIVYILALAIPALAMPLFRDQKTSENRELSEFPKVKKDGGWNEEFFSELDTWVNEHIGFRASLIDANNRWQQSLFGQSPNEKLIVGDGDWLYFSETENDFLNISTLSDRNFNNIAHTLLMMQDYAKAQGASFVVAVAPNKNSLYDEAMPYYYVPSERKGNWEKLAAAMDAAGVTYADLFEAFRAEDEVLYQHSDSHWNYKGALLAYNAILNRLKTDHKTFADATFSVRKDWEPDLGTMLYAGAAPLVEQLYCDYAFTYQVTSHESKVDAITLQTVCEGGEGSALVFRDSFCNTMQVYFAENFSEALFSRAYPYRMDYLSQYHPDVAVLEIVERNLPDLAAKAPVMQAPVVSLSIDASLVDSEQIVLQSEVSGSFLHIYGSVEADWLGSSYRAYLVCQNGDEVTAMEAFPIFEQELLGADAPGDNGFSLYVPKGAFPSETECRVVIETGGKYYTAEAQAVAAFTGTGDEPAPTPGADVTLTPGADPTPTLTPDAEPTPTPSAEPSPTPTPENTPTPKPTNTPTPKPENTPTPKPGAVTAENLDEYLESLLDKHGRSLRAIYDYVHDGFTFRSTVKTDVTTMACRILNTGSGSCWDYAALTSLLLKKAGYNCQIIVGVGAIASEHNWVIVEVESGVWRHMDTQHTKETFLLTDEELEARNGKSPYVNYEWDKSKYPKAE